MLACGVLVAGGGIGGLSVAVAAARTNRRVSLYEKAPAFGEVGAGLQLGPNATRILCGWGLRQQLLRVAALPEALVVRNARSGCELGRLPLGRSMEQRYGAPYATVHRVDLHALLHAAAGQTGGVNLLLDAEVHGYAEDASSVSLDTSLGRSGPAALLIGADGLHGAVRRQLLDDGPAWFVGEVSYRSMLDTSGLPATARGNQVTAWLGPGLHVVQYPVRQGAAMNLVVLLNARGQVAGAGSSPDADAAAVTQALSGACPALRELVASVPAASINARPWTQWPLMARRPLRSAAQMAQGRVALLGDTAHPMRPYLAQGAGMAIEDAAVLARMLDAEPGAAAALQRYAQARWQRCARVQRRSARNGRIFHASGARRWGRDAALRLLGPRLMDVPWLYGHAIS